jgi:fructose/tagatose bisphosphate aldolase
MAKRAHTGGRAVIIHSIDHARAACEAAAALGVPVTLMSAPGAAAYAGAGWFLKAVARASAEHPGARVTAVLDCGDEPGRALGALRQGCEWIRFTGKPRTAAKIAAIAEQYGAALYEGSGPTLDLVHEPDPYAACRAWLGHGGA